MEVEKFTFLKIYADSISKLAEWNEQLAKDLCRKIVQYWIYGINEESNDPILEALFIQIKNMIDKGKEISKINSENWKKKWKKETNKSKSKAKKSEKKRNGNETETKSNNIEHITYNIEHKTDNIEQDISLSNDKETETKVSEYWDSEINKCLDLIKSYNWWIIDWTIKKSRKYGKLLIWKLNKLDSIKKWKFTRYETLDILLKIISENKFYAWKITSPELIYENLTLLMNVCKKDIKKASSSSIVLESI